MLDKYSEIESFSIYHPLPIENESRKIPKGGQYKGEPFYGSWEERNTIRQIFISTLDSLSNERVKSKAWADYLLNDKGELDFQHMEANRSVHLSRAAYPYWTGLETNKNILDFLS